MGLKVVNVSKSFLKKKAVDDISFEFDKPGVFGLLGTNGAGKTTSIRMILGIMNKDAGEITWNGKEINRKNVNFGYLPEERGIYPKATIYNQLLYFARLKGMKKNDADSSIDYWLNRMEISEYKFVQAEKLSKGNQQKVQFIAAVMHDPELIILDEPFSGLDPVNSELIKNIINELVSKNGKYIIMSSHQMSSIEEFCTDVVILKKGRTVLKGNLNEIKDSYPEKYIEVVTNQDVENYINNQGLKVISKKKNDYVLEIADKNVGTQLLKNLVNDNIEIKKFEFKKPSLHEIFIEKVGE